MDKIMKKGPGTSYQSILGLQNMYSKISYLEIYHLGNLDDLMQSSFRIITTIQFFMQFLAIVHNMSPLVESNDNRKPC